MDPTISRSSSIRQTSNQNVASLESQQAEIFHLPLAAVSSPDDISSITWSEESYPGTISSTPDNHTKQISKYDESTINYEKQNKNKRIKILVISIIILLILMVIAMIITWIIILKLNDTTDNRKTSITTENINSNSDTTTPTTIPMIYDVGNGGASGDPPCSSYTVVNDPSRNIAAWGAGGTCDNGPLFNTNIGGRWIRFMGTGGTIMPLTSPGMNHCGAFLSGWFNESLPTTIGTIVDGNIYFELPGSPTIYIHISSSVVNCGNFYVYFLRPVMLCNARYCTV